jgi:hypothetical protein
MPDWLVTISEFPIYRYGLIFFAVVLLVPAVVSGNMVQHIITSIIKDRSSASSQLKPLFGNLAIFIICAAIIYYAVYIYLIN